MNFKKKIGRLLIQAQSNHINFMKVDYFLQLATEGEVRDSKHERDSAWEKGCPLLRWRGPRYDHLRVATES